MVAVRSKVDHNVGTYLPGTLQPDVQSLDLGVVTVIVVVFNNAKLTAVAGLRSFITSSALCPASSSRCRLLVQNSIAGSA